MSDNKSTCLSKICAAKEEIVCSFEKGHDSMSVYDAGQIADIIKDLAEAEYYCTVTEAMNEKADMDILEAEMYGYNPNRSSRSGRYMSGYRARPYLDQEPYMDGYLNDPEFAKNMRMGYTPGTHGGMSQSGSRMNMSAGYDPEMRYPDERYGRAYNEYNAAKTRYGYSHSENEKEQMKKHANEHLSDCIATLRDIWANADPELRKHMKSDLTTLVADMNV